MNDYINLKQRDTLKIGIKDEFGHPKLDKNGKEVYIEFDLEDINTPDNFNKCIELVKKAMNTLKGEITIIDKKEDIKKDGILSKKEQEKIIALKKYYKTTEEAIDLFLGKGGTNKIFGESRYLSMFDDLAEMLKPILPKLKINMESIEQKIKQKYNSNNDNILKDE